METVQGYVILKAATFETGHGFALGHNPGAPDPFVTWQFTEGEKGQRDYYWGRYGNSSEYLGFVLCRKATFDVPDIMLGLGLSFLVFSTITGIQMPLFFKMGYTKAKLWSVIPFAVVMLLVVLPSFVSALSGILDFAQSHKELFAFACILTSCIIQFVSYHIAVIFYRKQR